MTRFNKIKILISTSILSLAPLACIPYCLNETKISNIKDGYTTKDKYYCFDGQCLNDLDKLTNYVINNHNAIDSDVYIGDANNAVFDQNTQKLDITKLRKFDQSKLHLAYKNSLNEYDYDYDRVKKSFINPGLIQYKYDNMNGQLFNSYAEAKESLVNNTKKSRVCYYEYKDYVKKEIHKINPFSKKDIDELKKITIKDYLNGDPRFKFKVYGEEFQSGKRILTPNKVMKILSDKNTFNTLMNWLFDAADEAALNFRKKSSYVVRIKINGVGKGKDARFVNFTKINNGSKIRAKQIDEKTLEFSCVDYHTMLLFKSFLTRNEFIKYHNISIRKNGKKEVAEEAYPKDELKMKFGCSYYIQNYSNDKKDDRGIDVCILKPGSDKQERDSHTYFEVTIDTEDYNTSYFYNNFEENFKLISKEFVNTDNGGLSSELVECLVNAFKKGITHSYVYENGYVKYRFYDRYYYDNPHKNGDLSYFEDFCNAKYSKYCRDGKKIKSSCVEDLLCPYSGNLKNYQYYSELKHANSLNELVIEFNGKPLWLLNKEQFNSYEIDLIFSFLNDNLENRTISNSDINRVLQKNLNSNNLDKLLLNASNFNQNPNSKIVNDNYFTIDNSNSYDGNMKFNNEGLIEDAKNALFKLDKNHKVQYTINEAAYLYNLNTIEKKNEDSSFRPISTSPSCILQLYNERNLPQQLYYTELIGGEGTTESISTTNKVLFDDDATITNAIKNMENIEPVKVVILYDLLGNVINPGVQLSKDEELLTSNDAIYDSESTIINNLIRTKIIKNDPSKIFYKEGNEYILLDNKINQLYSLKWDDKIWWFKDYNSCFNYMKEIVKNNSILVEF